MQFEWHFYIGSNMAYMLHGIGGFLLSPFRMIFIGSQSPYYIVTRHKNYLSSLGSYFKPLDFQTWILLALTLLVFFSLAVVTTVISDFGINLRSWEKIVIPYDALGHLQLNISSAV